MVDREPPEFNGHQAEPGHALPVYQGTPRFEIVQSNSLNCGRYSKLKSHGWSPEDWVPIEQRREDRYPVRIFVANPKSPFPPAVDLNF
jgi:hypothetical protein